MHVHKVTLSAKRNAEELANAVSDAEILHGKGGVTIVGDKGVVVTDGDIVGQLEGLDYIDSVHHEENTDPSGTVNLGFGIRVELDEQS